MAKKVTIYTTPTCVYCRATKEFFKEHNVTYEEKDVARDMQAQQEMLGKAGQLAVPVIDIDGEVVIGFDKGRLSELLGVKSL